MGDVQIMKIYSLNWVILFYLSISIPQESHVVKNFKKLRIAGIM